MVSPGVRFDVFKRDSFTCQYCGRKSPDVILEADHITPKSKGGLDTLDNLITSCRECNRGKADSIILETYESENHRIYTELDTILSSQTRTESKIEESIATLNELFSLYHELQEQEFDLMIQNSENILRHVNDKNLKQFANAHKTLEDFKSDVSKLIIDLTQNRSKNLEEMTLSLKFVIEENGLLSYHRF